MDRSTFADVKRRAERRLNRVKEALDERTEPDEILDDFFVLWRAYEMTFDNSGKSLSKRAQDATIDTIGNAKLPGVLKFVHRFYDEFGDNVREDHLKKWFPATEDGDEPARRIAANLKDLAPALKQNSKWGESQSKSLAIILYSLRNAIFHGSFGTSKLDAEPQAFAGLREAMIELVRLRLRALSTSILR